MSELSENSFACIGCGAMNPVGAEVCSGCGHRFAGASVEPSPASVAPTTSPSPPSVPARPSAIPSILIVVVVFAIGVGISIIYLPLGIGFFVAALGSVVWTWFVSNRRAREGKPMGFDENVVVFSRTLGGAFLVFIASGTAFVATCFPIGFLAFNEGESGRGGEYLVWIAFGVGGVAALLAGGFMTRYLIRKSKAQSSK